MQLKFDHVWLIMSKDEKLIARGVPRDRCIYHIEEKISARLLTYSSKSKATSAFTDCGFYISVKAREYIKEKHPEIKVVYWNDDVQDLFMAKEFSVVYESIE